MFTTKDFPGRRFATVAEYEEARRLQLKVEEKLRERAAQAEQPASVMATIVPADPDTMERRMIALESRLRALEQEHTEPEQEVPSHLPVGMVLHGESKGNTYSLEVLPDGYLCSDGEVYPTLSAAAQGVSGNRRSGWKFWRDDSGKTIGEVVGRFRST